MRDFADYVDRRQLWGRNGFKALDYKATELTCHAPFVDGNVLELGAGPGLLSLWTLYRGARSAVSLEPEAAGSTAGVGRLAAQHREALGIDPAAWAYLPQTIQEYHPDRRFRLILSYASINHLDEDACMALETDRAQRRYLSIFAKLHDALEPGGAFVMTDAGRFNLWNRLGLASPWAPELEWHKHQEAETWSKLLGRAGFQTVSIIYPHPFYRLRTLGPLLSHRMAARCFASQFALTARRR